MMSHATLIRGNHFLPFVKSPDVSALPLSGLMDHTGEPGRTLSVSEVNDLVKYMLEEAFPSIWVAGEISNFSQPQSGHCYLTLKDDKAQLRAVMWRGTAERVRFQPVDGLHVVCHGRLDVYPARGSYQLVIQEMYPRGLGALELALRQLKERLAAEGLFAPERKRPLPRFPRRAAFVTSPSGAAIRDFLEILRRRWPGLDVLIIPVKVQGQGAAREIAAGIELVNQLSPPVDVLVVGRGGGSMEDLWTFNEEVVVRAIFESRIPVISAVGHEIDVTLSDLVADVRALTPSEAAERIAPATDDLQRIIAGLRLRLATSIRHRLAVARHRLEGLSHRHVLRRPKDRFHELGRVVDELSHRATRSLVQIQAECRGRLNTLGARLDNLSPLAVLERGYSLTSRLDDPVLVRDAMQVSPGELIATRVAVGRIISRVETRSP
jgi:exodeoxyribonuclease VII large subunit